MSYQLAATPSINGVTVNKATKGVVDVADVDSYTADVERPREAHAVGGKVPAQEDEVVDGLPHEYFLA